MILPTTTVLPTLRTIPLVMVQTYLAMDQLRTMGQRVAEEDGDEAADDPNNGLHGYRR